MSDEFLTRSILGLQTAASEAFAEKLLAQYQHQPTAGEVTAMEAIIKADAPIPYFADKGRSALLHAVEERRIAEVVARHQP